MPIPGARYRYKGNVRLAFVNGKVVEAKNMKTGDIHTRAMFRVDKKKAAKTRKKLQVRKRTKRRAGTKRGR